MILILYLVDKQLLDTDWLKIYQSKEEVTFVASCHHPICKIKQPTIQDILTYPIILTKKNAVIVAFEEKLHEDNLEIKPFIQSKIQIYF